MLAQPPPPTLYAHSIRAALAPLRLAPRTEYLVEDFHTHELLANTFAHPQTPIPPGSLLKPFVAFAHSGPFPAVLCRGHASGCWRAEGHGRLALTPALADSCNTYFLTLAAGPQDRTRLLTLGLAPPPDLTPRDWIGLTPTWLVAPLTLAEAYARLIPQASPALLAGMRGAAEQGTAARLHRTSGSVPGGVLAKTGTAPCLPQPGEPCTASGDGLVLVLVPALHPTTLILVRRRATTGAVTAETAGQIVATLVHLHAN